MIPFLRIKDFYLNINGEVSNSRSWLHSIINVIDKSIFIILKINMKNDLSIMIIDLSIIKIDLVNFIFIFWYQRSTNISLFIVFSLRNNNNDSLFNTY